MSQEEQQNEKRQNPFSPFKRKSEGGGNGPSSRGPRFSFYWIYAIVFAILISQFHAPRGRNSVRRLWHIFPEIHKARIRMVLRRFARFLRGSDPHTCAHLDRA